MNISISISIGGFSCWLTLFQSVAVLNPVSTTNQRSINHCNQLYFHSVASRGATQRRTEPSRRDPGNAVSSRIRTRSCPQPVVFLVDAGSSLPSRRWLKLCRCGPPDTKRDCAPFLLLSQQPLPLWLTVGGAVCGRRGRHFSLDYGSFVTEKLCQYGINSVHVSRKYIFFNSNHLSLHFKVNVPNFIPAQMHVEVIFKLNNGAAFYLLFISNEEIPKKKKKKCKHFQTSGICRDAGITDGTQTARWLLLKRH